MAKGWPVKRGVCEESDLAEDRGRQRVEALNVSDFKSPATLPVPFEPETQMSEGICGFTRSMFYITPIDPI